VSDTVTDTTVYTTLNFGQSGGPGQGLSIDVGTLTLSGGSMSVSTSVGVFGFRSEVPVSLSSTSAGSAVLGSNLSNTLVGTLAKFNTLTLYSSVTLATKINSGSQPAFRSDPLLLDYSPVFSTIAGMSGSDDEELLITGTVANAAAIVANTFYEDHFPVPKISRHGPNSAVFSWQYDEIAIYVTVTASKAYTMLTDTAGVITKSSHSLDGPLSGRALLSLSVTGTR